MVGMQFERLDNGSVIITPRDSAAQTVKRLIQVHTRTIALIDAGQKFTRKGKDVTREIKARCKFEISQCHGVLGALQMMGEGDIQQASALLSAIKEYIPDDN